MEGAVFVAVPLIASVTFEGVETLYEVLVTSEDLPLRNTLYACCDTILSSSVPLVQVFVAESYAPEALAPRVKGVVLFVAKVPKVVVESGLLNNLQPRWLLAK